LSVAGAVEATATCTVIVPPLLDVFPGELGVEPEIVGERSDADASAGATSAITAARNTAMTKLILCMPEILSREGDSNP
jgi:hypothetical protein